MTTDTQAWQQLRNHVLMCPQCYRVNHSPATVSEHGCRTGWILAERYRDAAYDAGCPEQFTMHYRPSRLATPRPRAGR